MDRQIGDDGGRGRWKTEGKEKGGKVPPGLRDLYLSYLLPPFPPPILSLRILLPSSPLCVVGDSQHSRLHASLR